MSESESRDLAPAEPPANLPALAGPAGGGVLSGTDLAMYCSARLTTEAERLTAMQAVMSEAVPLHEHDGIEIQCAMVIGHWTKEVEDEGGEVRRLRRFIFCCADGSRYSAGGVTIPQTVALLAGTFGVGPWEPPVMLRVRLAKNPPPKSPTVFLDCLGRAKPAKAKKQQR